VIISFDGKEIKEMNDLPYIVATTPVGKTVTVEVIRNGDVKRFRVEIEELEEYKEAKEDNKGTQNLGMTVEEITPEIARQFGLSEKSGLVIVDVETNSPAEEAAMHRGDIIIEVDQSPVYDLRGFQEKIRQYQKGDTILFLVKRQGNTIYLTLKVWE
jgi:serine protease Do